MLQYTTLVLSKMGLEHCLRFVVDAFHDVFVGSYANYLSVLYIMAVTRSNSSIGTSSVPRNTRGTSKTRKGGTATKSKGNKSVGNKSVRNKSVRNKPIGNKSVKEGFIQGINPTEGESIFESYLSVLIHLLGTQYIYGKIVQEISDVVTIQEVPRKNVLPVLERNKFDPIIYYYKPNTKKGQEDGEDGDGETHYRVYSYEKNESSRSKNAFKWKIIDPYDLYQKKKSHGFCQMFALYIATNKTDGFLDKTNVKGTISKEELAALHRRNTFECLKKTIRLIENLPEPITNAIKIEFSDLEKDPKNGIPFKMEFDDFVDDLKGFKIADLNDYIASLK